MVRSVLARQSRCGDAWYVRAGKCLAVKVRRVVAQRGKECLGAERKQ